MARLGKLERQIKAGYFRAIALTNDPIIARNLSQPKPERSGYTAYGANGKPINIGWGQRDETAILKGNTHTRGFSSPQRITHFQKKGEFKNA